MSENSYRTKVPELNSNPLNLNSKKIFSISKLINSNQIINFAKKLENPEICFKDSNTSLLSRSNSLSSLSYKNSFVMFPPKPSNKIKLIIEENEMDESTTSTSKLDSSSNFNESHSDTHNNSKRKRTRIKKRASLGCSSDKENVDVSKDAKGSASHLTKSNSLNIKTNHSTQICETDYFSPISSSSSVAKSNSNVPKPNDKNILLSSTINSINSANYTNPSAEAAKFVKPHDPSKKKETSDINLVFKSSQKINDEKKMEVELNGSTINFDAIINSNDNTEQFYTSTDEFIESIECDSTCHHHSQCKAKHAIKETVNDNNLKEPINTNKKSIQSTNKKSRINKKVCAYFDVFTYLSEIAYVLLTNFKYWCIFSITSFCFLVFFFTKLFLLSIFSFQNISSTLLSPFKLNFIKRMIVFFLNYPIEMIDKHKLNQKDKLGVKCNYENLKKKFFLHAIEAGPRVNL